MIKARLGRWHTRSVLNVEIIYCSVEMIKARLGRWHITSVSNISTTNRL